MSRDAYNVERATAHRARRVAQDGWATDPVTRVRSDTVDPNRVLSNEEIDALITIETTERLATRAAAHVSIATQDADLSRAAREALSEALRLLEAVSDETTTRTCTAVKRQSLSDVISHAARDKVRKVLDQ